MVLTSQQGRAFTFDLTRTCVSLLQNKHKKFGILLVKINKYWRVAKQKVRNDLVPLNQRFDHRYDGYVPGKFIAKCSFSHTTTSDLLIFRSLKLSK